MKENLLRSMIRKQIKSSLKTEDLAQGARGQVSSTLDKIEKMAGVKMLKKALGSGSPQQQAAGLLKVVRAISGGSPVVGKTLARMLTKGGISSPDEMPAPEAPMEEAAPAAVGTDQNDDLNTAEPSNGESLEEAVPASLKSRQGRVDKTAAMKMMKSTLSTKPATQQADFVIDLIKGLNIKQGAKQRLFQKMRRELGGKSEE
jgi:hypothetical protein